MNCHPNEPLKLHPSVFLLNIKMSKGRLSFSMFFFILVLVLFFLSVNPELVSVKQSEMYSGELLL